MDDSIIQIVAFVAVIGFLWTLHRDVSSLRKEVDGNVENLRKEVGGDVAKLRKEVAEDVGGLSRDMADLRERMARVEGLLEGFVARPKEQQS